MYDIVLKNYFICFVDLLGQKAATGGTYVLPTRESPEREKFTKAVFRSMEAILFIQTNFEVHVSESSRNRNPPPVKFSPEQREVFECFRNSRVKIQQFSDGIVLFSELGDDIGGALSSFYSIITACCSLMIGGLARGFPFRAGFALGAAVSVSGDDIYGPALAEAYRLESEVADFPRVVFSDSILSWLKSFDSRLYNSEIEKKVTLALREQCSMFLDIDEENVIFLNYFFKQIRAILEDVEGGISEIKKMREFVLGCKDDENLPEKVRAKYQRLHAYLESRA